MKIKGLRWWVITLIALATVINYIDRQSLSVLWPDISGELYPYSDNFDNRLIEVDRERENIGKEQQEISNELEEIVFTLKEVVSDRKKTVDDRKKTVDDRKKIDDKLKKIDDKLELGSELKIITARIKEIEDDLSNTDNKRKEIYAWISIIFIFSYAFGQAIFGKIFDWVGTRLGFALSIGVWSIATVLHAFARGVLSFGIFRTILGVAEAGNWPGATKGNAMWFPAKERAFAQGLFNSGAAIGGIISFPLIAALAIYFDSWKLVFILVGLIGFLWLIPWLIIVKTPPKTHPWLTDDERNYILSGQKKQDTKDDRKKVDDEYNPPVTELLKHKESWGVIIASTVIDPIWWLFVFWIPIYLNEVYGMDVKSIGLYGWVPYVGAMLGAWFGGLLAQNRIKKGWSISKTRKWIITLGCLIMLPSLLAMSNPGEPVYAVLIMAVILFGFQTAIGNVQTLPSDLFGKKTVGTLSGIAGMGAKLGAFGLTALVPWLTEGGNYTPAFIIGAALAIIALASVWGLCPKIEPLKPRS